MRNDLCASIQINFYRLLVGAPRANDSSLPGIKEPGAVFRCNWQYRSSCQPIFVDPIGNEKQIFRTWRNVTVDHKKDNQWLGASIDVNAHGNSNVMICAPRWVENQWFVQGQQLMNGLCYESNKELEFDETSGWPALDNWKKQIHSTGEYYIYGMGSLGSSAFYSQDGSFVVLGSPGINDFSGGFVHIETGPIKEKPKVLEVPVKASNSYFGSSIATARLTTDAVFTVVGGPRAGGPGKLGSSFGASVCCLDLNGDGLDDIVVGAPLYTNKMDEGKVYVYINREFFNLELLRPTLSGSDTVGARFGTAVANLGDLNLDGFQDLAVGAPYEGGGVVYIYNGANSGIHSVPSQKIVGKDLHKGLKAFGWSFSRPWDVDGNHYGDFAVGSFESDKVVLLRTRSVLDLSASLKLNPRIIDLTSKPKCLLHGHYRHCIEAEICFKYSGRNLPPSSEVNLTLSLDTLERHRDERLRMFLVDGKNTEIHQLHQLFTLRLDRRSCLKKKIFTRVARDVITPLKVELNYDIASSSIGIASMCTICPIRNTYGQSVNKARAQFALDCGLDHQCQPNLKIHVRPIFSEGKSTFLIDNTPYFDLEILVSNTGETSYLTVVTVAYPPVLRFSYVHHEKNSSIVSCVPSQSFPYSTFSTLECDIMSPLKAMKRAIFKMRFYAFGIPYNVHEFQIKLGVSSAGTKTDKRRMKLLPLTIPVQMSTQMKFSSFSVPGRLSFPHKVSVIDGAESKMWENISHLYVLRNLGPSPMPHGQIILTVPNSKWVKINNVLTCEVDFWNCSSVICYIGLMHKYETVFINVSLGIRKDVLQTFKVTNILGLVSAGELKEPNYRSYNSETIHHNITTTTYISYKPLPRKVVAWWVVVVSACSGLLLLYIIAVIMWKFGFFRRKKKEELQLLIKSSESEREILSPDSLSAGSSDVMVLPSGQLLLDQNGHHFNHNPIPHHHYPERDRLFYYPHLEPESPQNNSFDRDPFFTSRSLNRREPQHISTPHFLTLQHNQGNSCKRVSRTRPMNGCYYRNQNISLNSNNNNKDNAGDEPDSWIAPPPAPPRPPSFDNNPYNNKNNAGVEPDIWIAPPPAPPRPPSFDNNTYLEPVELLESRA
ncbi:integrin alpha-4-like [Plakobranchus ocellatus]|uniref:Integrin alpha-4-like n=1 Tax=Plakobranchus ocellatus TaxID=259542 RepID=A0AAV4BRI2_9GAST|nr:integrin alpha-4-like [Plakobranchus ocellatus]